MKKSNVDYITVINIDNSYYGGYDLANNIFEELIKCLIIKSKYKPKININEVVYIKSKQDKAILGYLTVKEIIDGDIFKLLWNTGHRGIDDCYRIMMIQKYKERVSESLCGLVLDEITEFSEHLSLNTIQAVDKRINLGYFINFIYDDTPIYYLITEWKKQFGLDGNTCKNPHDAKRLILKRAKAFENGK